MAKRYYYVKLDENFLDDVNIRRLRGVAGGSEYIIAYLKLILRTIRTGGLIEIIEGADMIEEIALLLNEPIKNVRFTLKYLQKYGLIQIHEMTVSVNYSMENVGSEADSTRRVREYRQRQKLLQCNADCNDDVTIYRTTVTADTNLEQQLQDIIDKYDLDKTISTLESESYSVDEIKLGLLLLSKEKNIKNPGGWLRRAVENGWTDYAAKKKESMRHFHEVSTNAARELMNKNYHEAGKENPTSDSMIEAMRRHKMEVIQ